MPPTAEETRARVAAALAFAGIDVKESDEKIGISYATMTRIVSKTSPRYAQPDERELIARKCGVPQWFLDHGFIPPAQTGEAEVHKRLDELSEQVARLQLERELAETAARKKQQARSTAAKKPGRAQGGQGQ